MPVKYVFVTGGVVSGLGKGITAASLGRLLKARGYKVIEGVAEMLLGRYPSAYGVRVKLEKPWAPVGLPLRSVSVEIERTRA